MLRQISIECRDHEQERKNKVKKTGFKSLKMGVRCISVAVLPLIVLLGALAEVKADEADAKRMVKAMSDYMAGQKSISFGYDSILEVATKDHQTLVWRVRVLFFCAGPTRSERHVAAVSPMSRCFLTARR